MLNNSTEVEELIKKSFAGATRRGGVSWSDSIILAEKQWDAEWRGEVIWEDRDLDWPDLLDLDWNPFPPDGGIFYTDAKSFSYYLAALLTHGVRNPPCTSLAYSLIACRNRIHDDLTDDQRKSVRAVIEFMLNWCRSCEHRAALRSWNAAMQAIDD